MERKAGLGIFQKYMSLWVVVAMVAGIILGRLLPGVISTLDKMTVYSISLPVAVLIWLMIYPMMLQIDFGSILRVGRNPKGLLITLIVNWAIKPFTMFLLAIGSLEEPDGQQEQRERLDGPIDDKCD